MPLLYQPGSCIDHYQIICHLEEVIPVDYQPDSPKLGGRYRQVVRLVFIILGVFLGIIAFGVFAQVIHGLAR